MPTFIYKGKTLHGQIKKGKIEAVNLAAANTILKKQHIIPDTISEKKHSGIRFGKTVKTKELVVFTRQFATMIDAGLPIVQCLHILAAEQENRAFKQALLDIKTSIESGATFTDALKRHPYIFDELYINLVSAGEIGGILDVILARLAAFMEKTLKIKRKIKGALIYPTIIIIIACIVVTVILVYVVPVFSSMFASFGALLPLPTQVVINMSNWLKNSWYLIIIGAVGIITMYRQIRKNPKGRHLTDNIYLKFPVFGPLIKKAAIARFTRTLGTMVSSGVPILEALEVVAKTSGNKIIEEAAINTRTALSRGKTLSEPLAETKVFPPMVVQMVSIGETAGALDVMLNKIADFYEDEVDVAVDAFMSTIEPLLITFLGIIVGGLVIAIYLPIFKMGEVIMGGG
ncbi:MAG: type II secretion system F family protein [Deltaproteobacteria bacterium]|nr:type II secretion system F family protein [Deltaproteobacteria bacterium]